jgi:hypothetical protein
MAEVSIDIDAMTSLVAAIGSARTSVPSAAGSVRGRLNQVWLSAPAVDKVAGGTLETSLESAERDLNRRLSLARLIAKSTPGLSVVTFDDSVISTASAAEIDKRVSQVVDLMDLDEGKILDDDGNVIDPKLLALLDGNALDPYFAKALATKLGPDKIDEYLRVVNKARSMGPNLGDFDTDDFNKKYRDLLSTLGTTLSMASRGTGDLAMPGMAKAWSDYLRNQEGDDGMIRPGAGNRLSLVIGQGQWSDDFLEQNYAAIRDVEGKYGASYWGGGIDTPTFDPFADQDDDGARIVTDPLRGLFSAMADNPAVVAKLFTGGDTTSVKVGGKDVQVNTELWDVLRQRGTLDESTVKAFVNAVSQAVGSQPVPGQTAWQPLLATDLTTIGKALDEEAKEAKAHEQPWWKDLAHGLLDLAGLIPVVGEPADLINGVWYYADGDVINGSLSVGSAIPFLGYAAVGGKWTRRALSVDELAKLNRLAKDGKNIRIFAKDGRVLDDVDLTDPTNFAPERFLSDAELARWSGSRAFMQKVIAGNRFNYFLNPRYDYSEIPLTTRNKLPFRLDSYTPGEAIVSRKLTQFSQITERTAKDYIDEFLKKYPEGTRIADTAKTRDLGIDGDVLEGRMILEVPPQLGGAIDPAIVRYAESKGIYIRDLNGTFYTKAPTR